MKNNYVVLLTGWLICMGLLNMAFPVLAQIAQPPVTQSQRVYPGAAEVFSSAYITKASDGTIGLITMKQDLLKLSTAGDILWTTKIPALNAETGLYAQIPAGIVPTRDAGFVVLASDRIGLYITKFSSSGLRLWAKKVADGTTGGKVLQTRDNGFLVTDTRAQTQINRGTFVTKYDSEGNQVWQVEIHYPHNLPSNDVNLTSASGAVSLAEGGYLLVGITQTFTGNTIFASWAAKLDDQGQVIWQNMYNTTAKLDDVIDSPFGDGAYIAAGYNTQSTTNIRTDILTIAADGRLKNMMSLPNSREASIVGFRLSLVAAPIQQGVASYTVFDTDSQRQGDFRLTNFGMNNQVRWTKKLGGSASEIAQGLVATDNGYVVVGLSTSKDGDLTGLDTQFGASWVINLTHAPLFSLQPPTYNCQTGAIVFNTTGGDGSVITFSAPGITRNSPTSNSGVVEAELRNDPKPITITATQSGYSTSYTFDFGAYCTTNQPPAGGMLTLLAPIYDCASGAFTFRTSQGNGSPIEYAAAGITSWSPNPNQFVDRESRTANDVQPFTLMARQNGVVVTYQWDLKSACGRARMGVSEPKADIEVSILGNPVRELLRVEVRGASNHPVQLQLINSQGQLLDVRQLNTINAVEQQAIDVSRFSPGLLLLQVSSGNQIQTAKVIKQ